MEENQQATPIFYWNAAIQLAAIFAYQQLAIIWPLYIVMFMLSFLILFQTLGAAYIFSKPEGVNTGKVKSKPKGIGILISLIYMVSCYHIYIIGFVGFAWVSAAHIAIHFFTIIFGVSKE